MRVFLKTLLNVTSNISLVTIGLLLHSGNATAEFISASAGGYGAQVQVGVTVLSADLLSLTPSQVSSQSGPPNFSSSSGLVNLNLNSSIGLPPITQLSLANVSGVGESSSSGTFSPVLSSNAVTGTGGVADFSLGIGRVSVLGSGQYAVEIGAGALSSTSSIFGTSSDVSVEGFSTFESLSVSILGTPLNLAQFGTEVGQTISFAPNTFIALNAFGLAGAGLYLNEQLRTVDDFGNFSIVTNALRLDLDAVNLGGTVGLLNGEVVLGHSNAMVVADTSTVPEPGSVMAICVAGAAMYGFRRKKNKVNKGNPTEERAEKLS